MRRSFQTIKRSDAAWFALYAMLALLLMAPCTFAQSDSCSDCVLGLFDDISLTQPFTSGSGASKEVYLGLKLGSGHPGFRGLEFSIIGLDSFLVSSEPLLNPTIVLGSPLAPADTLWGEGGMVLAWSDCVLGDAAILKLTLIPKNGWPTNQGVIVTRRFPASNPNNEFPLFTQCDDPLFTPTRVPEGITVINSDPGAAACLVETPSGTTVRPVPEGSSGAWNFSITNTGGGFLRGTATESCNDFSIANPSYFLTSGQTHVFEVFFAPQQPGTQTCVIDLSSSCAPLEVTGRSDRIRLISELYDNALAIGDSMVTIEGQVTHTLVYASSTCFERLSRIAWVTDESGRGIRLYFAPGRAPPDGFFESLTQRYRVAGHLDFNRGSMEMPPTFYELLPGGYHPVQPMQVSIADIPTLRDGDFVESSGIIGDEIETCGYYGRVFYSGADSTRLGYGFWRGVPPGWTVVRGMIFAVDEGNELFGSKHITTERACSNRNLLLEGVSGETGDLVQVPLRINNSFPGPVDSLALGILFDPEEFQLRDVQRAALTQPWEHLDWSTSGDSIWIELAGSQPIPASLTGEIALLEFEVLRCRAGSEPAELFELGWDLSSYDGCAGLFECLGCLSDGDSDGSGTLTPGDALCAFETFLNGQEPSPECNTGSGCVLQAPDIDCDRVVTPSDALAIFQRWLHRLPPWPGTHCETAAQKTRKPMDRYRIRPDQAKPWGDGLIAVPIEVRAEPGAAAFGVEIELDDQLLAYRSLVRTEMSKNWTQLEARLRPENRLMLGGFTTDLDTGSAEDWTHLAWIVFEATAIPRSLPVRWLDQTTGASMPHGDPEETTGSSLTLLSPYPNPARNGVTSLAFRAPRSDVPIRLRIYDVLGRQIRELHNAPTQAGTVQLNWDGLDASRRPVAAGIYLLRLEQGSRHESRKMVVLR